MRRLYAESGAASSAPVQPDARTLELAFRNLSRNYDYAHAGFGGAPKFPPTMALEFLLRWWRRSGNEDALRMARETFLRMARGGICDQVGGGFARYSVDAQWMVPHFEKMLYDNALLIRFGAHLFLATGDAEVRRVVEETIEWARREMLSPEGAFYSSYDADSEGEEGRYYIWTLEEFRAAISGRADALEQHLVNYFGVTAQGNFEGANILHRPFSDEIAAARAGVPQDEFRRVVDAVRSHLLALRAERVAPGRDDKIIASWNGLMVRALGDAARAFGSPDIAAVALCCADFLFERMTRHDADNAALRVFRTYNRGEARIDGFLEDHASLGIAALSAYTLTFDTTWLERARQLGHTCTKLFWTDTGFHDTAAGTEQLITRPRDLTDNALPSGNSLATELLLLLAEYFGDRPSSDSAMQAIAPLTQAAAAHPTAFGQLLCAIDTAVFGTLQVAFVRGVGAGDEQMLEMRRVVDAEFVPAMIAAGSDAGGKSPSLPLLDGKTSAAGSVTAYLCHNYSCDAPASSPDVLRQQLQRALAPRGNMQAGVAQ
jgi:uncharacterized protein YyaL (SSP411 family)